MRHGLTCTQAVLYALNQRELRTSHEIWEMVESHLRGMPAPRHVSLATVSGILRRLVGSGDARRLAGFGPRGGYGYVLTRKGLGRYVG